MNKTYSFIGYSRTYVGNNYKEDNLGVVISNFILFDKPIENIGKYACYLALFLMGA